MEQKKTSFQETLDDGGGMFLVFCRDNNFECDDDNVIFRFAMRYVLLSFVWKIQSAAFILAFLIFAVIIFEADFGFPFGVPARVLSLWAFSVLLRCVKSSMQSKKEKDMIKMTLRFLRHNRDHIHNIEEEPEDGGNSQ